VIRQAQWEYPEPRKGLGGLWDNFFGPGATTLEVLITLISSLVALIALLYYAYVKDLGWSVIQNIVAGVLVFDLAGGVVWNATTTAKRWFHRKEQTPLKHIGFVAVHIVQIFLFSFFFRGLDIVYIIVAYVYLLVSSFAVVFSPVRIQRALALILVMGAFVLSTYVFSLTPGFEWFLPALFTKLLISHLTYEEPYV